MQIWSHVTKYSSFALKTRVTASMATVRARWYTHGFNAVSVAYYSFNYYLMQIGRLSWSTMGMYSKFAFTTAWKQLNDKLSVMFSFLKYNINGVLVALLWDANLHSGSSLSSWQHYEVWKIYRLTQSIKHLPSLDTHSS